MTCNSSTVAARRFVTALILAAVLPQSGLAVSSDAGIWKIDPAKSNVSSGAATLVIQRTRAEQPAAGAFLLIANGSVYRITAPVDSGTKAHLPVDYASMMRDGKAVLIGTKAQSEDHCRFRCQAGIAEPSMTLRFKVVVGAEQQINDMLAYDRRKQ